MFDYARFEELRAQKGVTKKFIADKLGRAPAICTDWRLGKSSPKQDQMRIIAEILDTTVEYLDGKTDKKEKPADGETMSEKDKQFIDMWGDLTEEQKEAAIAFMRAFKK
mgnify:CR=1 FL=1